MRKPTTTAWYVDLVPLSGNDRDVIAKELFKTKWLYVRIVAIYLFAMAYGLAGKFRNPELGLWENYKLHLLLQAPILMFFYILLNWRVSLDLGLGRKRKAYTIVVNTGAQSTINGVVHRYVNVKLRKKTVTPIAIPETMYNGALYPGMPVITETGRFTDLLLHFEPLTKEKA